MTGVRRDGPGLVAETARGAVSCALLVNCAGLQSDRVARLCGAEPDVRIVPFRGEYYELAPERRSLVRGLIYPVPDPRFPFLGVHLTRRVDGAIEAGPNAVLALKREGYRWRDVSAARRRRDRRLAGLLAPRGPFLARSAPTRSGARSPRGPSCATCSGWCRRSRPADVHRAGSGVRAQALDAKGGLVDDFRIVRSERAIHVLNAPSPGATASIRIGERIAAMAESKGHARTDRDNRDLRKTPCSSLLSLRPCMSLVPTALPTRDRPRSAPSRRRR